MDEESSTCSRHDCSARPEHPRHRNCVRPLFARRSGGPIQGRL